MVEKFILDSNFINKYKDKQPNWGPIGYITYKRTYSRPLENGDNEEYWQTVQRVVEGVFEIQRLHAEKNKLPWYEEMAQIHAQEMYRLMWEFKFTPPGRGLWMMGTDYVLKRGGASLNNCAFVSTENLDREFSEPFCFLMDMSMLGVGVGGDARGTGKVTIQSPLTTPEPYVVPDTREGWINVLRILLDSYVHKERLPVFDYSQVRPFGEPIKGFGGVASGPGPLIDMEKSIKAVLDKRVGQKITSSDIVDIFNLVGRCVVSGNVRRSAEIMFGEADDKEFLDLKNPEINQEALYSHRWASNNSIFAKVGMDYTDVATRTAKNGEPGYEWLENAQDYGRMRDNEENYADIRARGGNPCLEQTLEPYELCCLVETYPSNHDSIEEWLHTLKYAFMYAKTVTLVPTHNTRTNSVMARNRRIGCSASGLVQAFKKFGRRQMLNGMSTGYNMLKDYDAMISEEFAVPKSIKITSVKPSGTVSLLAGVTPGVHYPYSEYYIRNIRFQEGSPLLKQLEAAGYKIEKDAYSPMTYVVSFPVKESYFDRSIQEVSMWEQLENAAQIQHYWADNQVSVTINFSAEEAKDIKNALELYETRLKGVSFLPKKNHKYVQAPYIPITKEEYEELSKNVKPELITGGTHEVTEKFCDSDTCTI